MGFYENRILIGAAVIPAVALLLYVYKADKLDKESPSMLVSLVLRGIIATFGALITEKLGVYILGQLFPEGSVVYNLLLYFVVVAVSEEGFKYLLLRYRTWSSPEFNCQFDGVVYAVFVSLGFALWENISYVLMYGLGTAAVRAVTAIPGHGCFGVFMGAFYGLAKRYDALGYAEASKSFRVLALVCPALLHGCYDYIATMESAQMGWVFLLFIGIMFLVAWSLIRKLSKNDKFIDHRNSYLSQR